MDLEYIGFHNTRRIDNRQPKLQTVGFFMDDKKFQAVVNRPWNYVDWLKQYKQVMSPDISCYLDMSVDEIIESVFINRLISAYWQSQGLIVISTISWCTPDLFDICFSGIEPGSVVAVSTIGTRHNKAGFMLGFKEMCRRIKPEFVICYCQPYPEMYNFANILVLEHEGKKASRLAKDRLVEGQLDLFEVMLEGEN